MAAVAFGLLWIAYTAGLYGYCLIRGYDITPKQLLSPEWPPGSGNRPPSAGGGGGGGGGGSLGNSQTTPTNPKAPGGGGYRPPGTK